MVEQDGTIAFIRSLRSLNADLLINMRPFSLRSSLVCLCSAAKKIIRFSKNKKTKQYQVYLNTKKYIAYNYLDLLRPLGAYDEKFMESVSHLKQLSNLNIDINKKNIVCIVGAGEEYKRWGIENFYSLINLLGEDFYFHLVLGPNQQDYLTRIKNEARHNIFSYVGKPLPDLSALCDQADIIISNDCGPSHIGQFSKTPYIGLWGWGVGKKVLFPRFSEWHYPRPGSYALLARLNQEVKTISPQEVATLVKGICSQIQKNHESVLARSI